jgi:hypothetical protein
MYPYNKNNAVFVHIMKTWGIGNSAPLVWNRPYALDRVNFHLHAPALLRTAKEFRHPLNRRVCRPICSIDAFEKRKPIATGNRAMTPRSPAHSLVTTSIKLRGYGIQEKSEKEANPQINGADKMLFR